MSIRTESSNLDSPILSQESTSLQGFSGHSSNEPKHKRPFSRRNGMSIKDRYVNSESNPVNLHEGKERLLIDLDEAKNTAAVFKNGEGKTVTSKVTSRFTTEYAKEMYKRILDFDRVLVDEYSDPHTAHITLNGDSFNDEGGFRAPVDYLYDLLESWSNVTDAISYALRDREYEYCAVIGPTKQGYSHIHIAVWVDGPISNSDFHSAVDAHVRNSSVADEEYHAYPLCISTERVTDRKRMSAQDYENGPTTAVAKYLAGHLVTLDKSLREQSEAVQYFATTLDACGKRQVRASKRFGEENRNYQKTDNNGDEWEFVGMEVNGDVHEVENDSGGGSNFTEIKGLPMEVDPVSH